jgi:hypothetical protein
MNNAKKKKGSCPLTLKKPWGTLLKRMGANHYLPYVSVPQVNLLYRVTLIFPLQKRFFPTKAMDW